MARTSDETLCTKSGRPFALARYISPNSSSRTGQKSFSKASRLENIAGSPFPEDAAEFANERLTTTISSVPGGLLSGIRQTGDVIRPGAETRARDSERRIEKQADAAVPRENQFAAMKIDRPKPVRWCSA